MTKKLVAALLAVVMLLSLGAVGAFALTEEEAKFAEVYAIVEEYNKTHGGTGALEVKLENYSSEVYYRCYVSGEVRGATKGITFPDGFFVLWSATLTGMTGGEAMVKSLYEVSVYAGMITSNAVAVESKNFQISGTAVITGNIDVHSFGSNRSSAIHISGGTINGDVRLQGNNLLLMYGGVINGAVSSGRRISVHDDAVINATEISADYIDLYNGARIYLDAAGTVRTKRINVCEPSLIDFEDRLQDCILVKSKPINYLYSGSGEYVLDKETWTVIGDVDLGTYMTIDRLGALVIPQGSKLTLTDLYISDRGGKIVVDGELVNPGDRAVHIFASVSGKNAAAFIKGAKIIPILSFFNWYAGPLVQSILRQVFFGSVLRG